MAKEAVAFKLEPEEKAALEAAAAARGLSPSAFAREAVRRLMADEAVVGATTLPPPTPPTGEETGADEGEEKAPSPPPPSPSPTSPDYRTYVERAIDAILNRVDDGRFRRLRAEETKGGDA